ncbi:MAG: hypothetical protein P1V51_07720 [Deltaproteobacteria bacterium]|nr:hypothetical protein [Deltaproteobacteria bacterium]
MIRTGPLSIALAALLLLPACGPEGGGDDGGSGMDNPWVRDGGAPDGSSDGGLPDGSSDGGGLTPGVDSDGDGLDDVWEDAAGMPGVLDWDLADTDGDGTPDGDEDPDGDGLTNLEEFALSRLTSSPAGHAPDPTRIDLVVELDAMDARALSDAILAEAVAAYDAAPLVNQLGVEGIGLTIYRDQESIPVRAFDGAFAPRHALLADNGPRFGDQADPPIPYGKLIHVVVATQRTDLPTRGGEVVTDGNDVLTNTGVILYPDALAPLHPACDGLGDPPITLDEAITATFVHELGHTLMLGHETDLNGGVNDYNIMAVPGSCGEAQRRFHGLGNTDPDLGNTEAVAAPRFSVEAAALMDFTQILSVHRATMGGGGDGFEM